MDVHKRPWSPSAPRATTGKENDVQLCLRASCVAVLLAGVLGAEDSAQTPEQFYAGKTVDFVIGYPPGGSNDTFGRLLARHLGKHIPGKPSIVPKNQTGAGSFLAVNTIFNVAPKDGTLMNNVFGTNLKLVMGYKCSNEATLTVERGKVEGHSTSWTALKVAHPDWIRDKSVSILVQFSLKRHVELPDIPTAVDLGRSDEERAILGAIMNAAEVGTAFFTTPGAPADRLAALRRAFDATMKDAEFLADVEKIKLGVSPMTGEELQKLVAEVSNLSPALLDKVRAAYTTKAH